MGSAHDIVVLESAFEDMASPPPSYLAKRRANGRNESWRERPLETYIQRLSGVLDRWKRCVSARPPNQPWRGIFQLAAFPRARGLQANPRSSDCTLGGQRGMASEPHHIAEINQLARRMVEEAGFEAFDPSAVTLHADPKWFDALKTELQHDERKIEPVSDLTSQLLINHICSAGAQE